MFVDMEPEDQLCLMLARGELSAEVRERTLELLASPLRWPLFLAHTKKYDICPIIYQNLETLGFRSVPDPIRAELTKIFGVNSIRSEVFGKETARILQLIADSRQRNPACDHTIHTETEALMLQIQHAAQQ
jgi:hypothetical protein